MQERKARRLGLARKRTSRVDHIVPRVGGFHGGDGREKIFRYEPKLTWNRGVRAEIFCAMAKARQ